MKVGVSLFFQNYSDWDRYDAKEFDRPPDVPVTPAPSAETLRLMREVVAPELAEVYPQFAARVFGIKAAS